MNPRQLNAVTPVNKLPTQSMPQPNNARATEEVPRLLRVFLVEDSPHVRDLLLDFLNEPGEVEIVGYADTETDSVAAILADPVDVVIVDLRLREGSGMAVIEKLRQANLQPQPKIIVFTNHPFPEIRARAMQIGADYFFDKSADYDSIRTTLQALRAH